jgi:hypothetical protein
MKIACGSCIDPLFRMRRVSALHKPISLSQSLQKSTFSGRQSACESGPEIVLDR